MTAPTVQHLAPFEAQMTALRHDLHRHPEIGFDLPRTAETVAVALETAGLEVHREIGGCGVVGLLRRGTGKGRILLRADMDALPIDETARHDHRSQNAGAMHACGHDGHTATLLGAAMFLARQGVFDGTAIFLFQPNEEHGLGARAMLDDGVLDRFGGDEVYGLHCLPGTPLGQVATRVGTICASETLFEIEIRGQGGHAAMPQAGRDAIMVGAEVVQALQTIVARKLRTGAGVVVSVTGFDTDGARNVLAGRAVLTGDIRTQADEDLALVQDRMRGLCAGIAAAHGVAIGVDLRTEFVETVNAAGPVSAVAAAAEALGLKTDADAQPVSFSEDFGQFARQRPGCFLLLGNGTEGGHGQPLHSSDFDFNDKALTIGAALWARLVHDRLSPDRGQP